MRFEIIEKDGEARLYCHLEKSDLRVSPLAMPQVFQRGILVETFNGTDAAPRAKAAAEVWKIRIEETREEVDAWYQAQLSSAFRADDKQRWDDKATFRAAVRGGWMTIIDKIIPKRMRRIRYEAVRHEFG